MEIARESGIYKVHIASRILSGMEKETPLREETSTLCRKVVERKGL